MMIDSPLTIVYSLLYFRKNVRKFEILTMQIAVVVPFVLFVKAVLWTDDQRVLDGVSQLKPSSKNVY